jgi:holo-ACP synthase CitX
MRERVNLRQQLLAARDARQSTVERGCGNGRTLIFVGTNVPGPDKDVPGVGQVFGAALRALAAAVSSGRPFEHGRDVLGPWAALAALGPADEVKRAAVRIEERGPGGRLVDIDVYAPDGRPVDRRFLGLGPRQCLLCGEAAVDCVRAGRHDAGAVAAAAMALLRAAAASLPAGRLAAALVDGARAELDLTPKPGLVDRLDNGSHPDLSFEAMSRSIDLLPVYFDELLDLHGAWPFAADQALGEAIEAGRRAERRMTDAIGANAHRGYIFLAGLLLLAAVDADPAGPPPTWRPEFVGPLRSRVRRLAASLLTAVDAGPTAGRSAASHGSRARQAHGLGGIHAEALAGLPSVFDRGLPAFSAVAGLPATTRGHHLLAVLMQAVEDTTAVHRGGLDALARIRRDGAELQRIIDRGESCLARLADLNRDYRRMNLTMGGVADCLALTLALGDWLGLG